MLESFDNNLFQINKGLPTPAYLQLKVQLLEAIDAGRLPAGIALPSEREMADSLGLSRMTVRRAFEELVSEKQLEQRQGSGTYVLPKRVEQTIDRVLGFVDEARNLGFKADSEMLECQQIPATKRVAEALQIKEGSKILSIKRLRTADAKPLALQTAHLIPDLKTLSVELLIQYGSLYKTIKEQFGLSPQGAKQTVSAKLPSEQECELLDISKEVPVLELERITLDKDARPFEYVLSSYRGDRYKMIMDLRAP